MATTIVWCNTEIYIEDMRCLLECIYDTIRYDYYIVVQLHEVNYVKIEDTELMLMQLNVSLLMFHHENSTQQRISAQYFTAKESVIKTLLFS